MFFSEDMDWQPTTSVEICHNDGHTYGLSRWLDFAHPTYSLPKITRYPKSSLFSAAKRLCRGLLHTAYSATADAIANATYKIIPTYLIVRQVRRKQKDQQRRPHRKRRRISSPLTKSGVLVRSNDVPTETLISHHQPEAAQQPTKFQHLTLQSSTTVKSVYEAIHERSPLPPSIVKRLPNPQQQAEKVCPQSAEVGFPEQQRSFSTTLARSPVRRRYQSQPQASRLETHSSLVTTTDGACDNSESIHNPHLLNSTTPLSSPPHSIYEFYLKLQPTASVNSTGRLDSQRDLNVNKIRNQEFWNREQNLRLDNDAQSLVVSSRLEFRTVAESTPAAKDACESASYTVAKMPVSLSSPFGPGETYIPIKRPPTPEYRVAKYRRRPSTLNSSSSDEPLTPQKQVIDIKRFLKRDEPAIKQDTDFTPVRPTQLKTPWHDQPIPMETEFDATITWDPIQDKEYRRMCRACPETKDPKTGEFLPIDGVLSPESFQYNIDIRANKQLIDKMKTPGLSVDLSKLSIEDRTPKASRHRERREGRITRANVRRLELEKERDQFRITRLSQEWIEKVKSAVRKGFGNYQASDFARVVPQYAAHKGQDNWLNDEVINGYLKMIADHGKKGDRKDQVPSHHAFNSFFYSNLKSKGPESIKNWAKRAKIGGKNLLETEKVFIPINQGMHWTLAIVQAKDRRITVYNSLGNSRGEEVATTLLSWVETELGASFDAKEWILDGDGVSPQQENSDDCGVFAITNARQVMLGKEPAKSYGPGDIPIQRMRIVAELINGALLKER